MSQKNFHINMEGENLEEDALLFDLLYQMMDEVDAEYSLDTDEEALRRRIFFGEPAVSETPVPPVESEGLDLDDLVVLAALLDEE